MLSDVRATHGVTLATGGAHARRRASLVDQALHELASTQAVPGLALVAVGGYGRGALSPNSDVDLLLVPGGPEPSREQLQALLYPLWDAGLQVGHAVRTADEAIDRARGDLHAATALLSARLVGGDPEPFATLMNRRDHWLREDPRTAVRNVLDGVAELHRGADRAGWVLAPDLREDVGGLRDLHAVDWLRTIAAVADAASGDGPERPAAAQTAALTASLGQELHAAGETLLAAREGLHAVLGRRRSDRLRIDLQPAVARRLGLRGPTGADQLMNAVHTAARTVEHRSASARQETAEQVLDGPRQHGRVVPIGHGIRLVDGNTGAPNWQETADPAAGLRLLAAEAATGRVPALRLHEWLRGCFGQPAPARWDEDTMTAFLDLLRLPDPRWPLELLDHVNGWPALLPEWSGIRALAQYDHYHRYTVDGHLLATVHEVHRAVDEGGIVLAALEAAGDPTALEVAALLHDLGKSSGQDHSVAGARLARAAGDRMGLAPGTVDEVTALVRWHLLLTVTATRRDLDDPTVAQGVAARVGSVRILHLLYVLSVADARATGPEAWTPWKETLVQELYRRALRVLEEKEQEEDGDEQGRSALVRAISLHEPALAVRADELLGTLPPSYLRSGAPGLLAAELRLLTEAADGDVGLWADAEGADGHPTVTVRVPDRPGTLARTAGVLALHRLSVLRAQAWSQAQPAATAVTPGTVHGFERLGNHTGASAPGDAGDERPASVTLAHSTGTAPDGPGGGTTAAPGDAGGSTTAALGDPSGGGPVSTASRQGRLRVVRTAPAPSPATTALPMAERAGSGVALERFVVAAPHPGTETDWKKVEADLRAAHSGRLAVEARLARRSRTHDPAGRLRTGILDVRVLADASEGFTVVEVRARDTLGLLHGITAALTELDLDIHVAKIDTLGERVVDVFYVRTANGAKLTPGEADEVAMAVRHRVERLLGG